MADWGKNGNAFVSDEIIGRAFEVQGAVKSLVDTCGMNVSDAIKIVEISSKYALADVLNYTSNQLISCFETMISSNELSRDNIETIAESIKEFVTCCCSYESKGVIADYPTIVIKKGE